MLPVLYRLPRGAALPDEVFSIGFISVKAASFGSSWHAESSRICYEFRVQGGQEASHSAYAARREVLSRGAQKCLCKSQSRALAYKSASADGSLQSDCTEKKTNHLAVQ